jgi:beta-glucosidase
MTEGDKAEDITGSVKLIVTNRGRIAGAEVVQLYVRDVASALPRPLKEFKGCVKVLLEPGQKQELTITLNKYTFSYYVEREARWRAESGEFELILAKSSRDRDAVLSARTVLRKTTNWVGV